MKNDSKNNEPKADSQRSSEVVDFDLHGLVGIRLLDPAPHNVRTVTRQLGPIHTELQREPDILIQFVDRIDPSSPIKLLGVDDAGYNEDTFFVMRPNRSRQTKMQLDFTQIGGRCTIVCERDLASIPLLIAIVNLTMLTKGVVPLHASAFSYHGTGILTTGWAKGGKTETLLAFVEQGAEYVGDEWVYISNDGQRMFGIPQPITLWDWHLKEQPQYRKGLGHTDRIRLWSAKLLSQVTSMAISHGIGRGSSLAKVMEGIYLLSKRQLYIQLPVDQLTNQPVVPQVCAVDLFVYVASHELPDVVVEQLSLDEVLDRMVHSLQYERMDFMSYYLKFLFAFPSARNELIERAADHEREMLKNALGNKIVYGVFHPYPVSISALFAAMSPLCVQPEHL